ncbi:hypothetical protein PG989_003207 [Apiospora arundinis]|uniref:Uncharacterized protein n=1 Tax=Apiospora arundinis TaxID=335852 RepID=A0ABR2I2K6_9PEZI
MAQKSTFHVDPKQKATVEVTGPCCAMSRRGCLPACLPLLETLDKKAWPVADGPVVEQSRPFSDRPRDLPIWK